ncbi:MAG: hypothetical protein K0R02_136 [Rickettsiaceae bacterium]|jgi:uncharacterized membrane protein|nr:hypothetical protein [Rickettsiaceae bacterium]
MQQNSAQDSFKYTSLVIKIIAFGIALGVLFISKYVFVFFVSAMLPTVGAVIMDKRETKCISATICTFNLIGVLPFLFEILRSSNMNSAAKMIISDILTWLTVYITAFVGQLVIWILPEIVAKLYLAKSTIMISMLESKRDKLCEEWGIDKKKFITDNLSDADNM